MIFMKKAKHFENKIKKSVQTQEKLKRKTQKRTFSITWCRNKASKKV